MRRLFRAGLLVLSMALIAITTITAVPQVAHAASSIAATLAPITMPEATSNFILTVLLLGVSAINERSFEWVQDKWEWLNQTKPLVRFVLSGLYGGLVGWLALQIGHAIPADFGQMDLTNWTAVLTATTTWAWHALVKAKEASA